MHRVLPFVSSLVVAVAAMAMAGSLAAQIEPPIGEPKEVAVTGVIQALPFAGNAGTPICAPANFALECSDGAFFLHSSTLDLGQYVGQNLRLYGTAVPECPLVDVHTVEAPPPATLLLCGTGGFGCPVRLRSGPGGLAQHWLFASLSPAFVPLNLEKGSFLIGQPFFQIGTAFSNSFGTGAAFDFSVPVVPALAGMRIYFQAARREVGITTTGFSTTPPVNFSNAACIDIVGFTLLCIEPEC